MKIFEKILVNLVNFIRGSIDFSGRVSFFLKRSSLKKSIESEPIVSFGQVLEEKKLIHGGAIKLLSLKKFFPLAERAPLKHLRLLTLGTHNYAQRVFSTLECLALLHRQGIEATLTIAGKYLWFQGEDSVRQQIERLKLAGVVNLFSSFNQEEALQFYQSHHLVLHPKYLDPCPTVVLEALACGCPVIGSASGGLPELVSSECGHLISLPLCWDRMITPTGAQLAEGVMNLLPRWHEAARAARLRAECLFDEERWVERHQEIFKSF